MTGESGAIIAVTIFMLSITGALTFLNIAVKNFTKTPISNLILKRCLWLFILALMWLNTAIMFTLTNFAVLNLQKEMTRYIWLFGAGIVMTMFFVAWTSLVEFLQLWHFKKQNKRMGDDQE